MTLKQFWRYCGGEFSLCQQGDGIFCFCQVSADGNRYYKAAGNGNQQDNDGTCQDYFLLLQPQSPGSQIWVYRQKQYRSQSHRCFSKGRMRQHMVFHLGSGSYFHRCFPLTSAHTSGATSVPTRRLLVASSTKEVAFLTLP